jgi:hypothetical protein
MQGAEAGIHTLDPSRASALLHGALIEREIYAVMPHLVDRVWAVLAVGSTHLFLCGAEVACSNEHRSRKIRAALGKCLPRTMTICAVGIQGGPTHDQLAHCVVAVERLQLLLAASYCTGSDWDVIAVATPQAVNTWCNER